MKFFMEMLLYGFESAGATRGLSECLRRRLTRRLCWKPSVLTSAGFKENRVLFLAAARQGYDEDASVSESGFSPLLMNGKPSKTARVSKTQVFYKLRRK